MRKMFTAALVAALALPAATAAKPLKKRIHAERHFTKIERTYLHLYPRVAHEQGARAPGRNIVRFGLSDGTIPSLGRVQASTARLRFMLWRPPVAQSPPSMVQSAPAPVVQSGGGGLPGCASESGTNYSTGPGNTNPSGATGRYQIIPSTHAALCSDLGWSPGEQDACAGRIYASQGAGAWVNC